MIFSVFAFAIPLLALHMAIESHVYERIVNKLNARLPPDKITGPVIGLVLAPVETIKSVLPKRPSLKPEHGWLSLSDKESGTLSIVD